MNRYDHCEIRCLKLGGQITFAYCRREQGDLPCARIVQCWQGLIPVEHYLQECLSDEERQRLFSRPPKDRISTILEIADRVKKRNGT